MVIAGDDGAPTGIVTDRDLRTKVVAAARDPTTTTAADVMSAPLVTVAPGAYGFEALLEMTRRGIHHLAVVEEGRLLGVVSSNDFLRLHATHPVTVAREIAPRRPSRISPGSAGESPRSCAGWRTRAGRRTTSGGSSPS